MFLSHMAADYRSFVLLYTLMMVSACKADIICITQITLKEIYNVLLIDNWRFRFLSSTLILWLVKTECTSVFIFRRRSLSCSHSLFADLWSLKGRDILTGISLACCRVHVFPVTFTLAPCNKQVKFLHSLYMYTMYSSKLKNIIWFGQVC